MNVNLLEVESNLFSYSVDLKDTDKKEFEIENENKILKKIVENEIPNDGKFSLKMEANQLQLAYVYNKILSLSNSRTRILAHQVESTHIIVNALKQRFLIADEVGLGKTIEAGLVIKEMIYRHNYESILVTAPASLLYQWQAEMESKFNEHFVIMNRKLLNEAQKIVGEKGNPWKVHKKIICSIDFIKNEDFFPDLEETKWDAVIFDEAHRLRRDANTSTKAYVVAEMLAERSKFLLLLSATPFRGNLEELYYLIYLIDPNVLGPFRSFYSEYCVDGADLSSLKKKLSNVIIRRTKKDIGGFTERHARTIQFELYADERLLYDETTKYVIEEFNKATQSENRAVGFVMTVFQKLLDSSAYALHRALSKRKAKLQLMLDRAEGNELIMDNLYSSLSEELEEMPDEIEEIQNNADGTIERTIEDLKSEINTLTRLVNMSGKIEQDKKGEKFIELINLLQKEGHKKFLIFTQFRTTQDYLMNLLKGTSVVAFNGSMSLDEKEQAIIDFKNDVEILIATEAGGEGRNMQFCNVLINYDLPWSPLKIEQRIGRIHRFGQVNDSLVFNFSTKDTVAERVLQVLTEKLRLFEESIGTPDIMLGDMEDEFNINKLFMSMASGEKSQKDIELELDSRMQWIKDSYAKLTDLNLADKMDLNYDEYYKVTLKERQFSNNRIEKFVMDLNEIDSLPSQILGKKNKKQKRYKILDNLGDQFIKGKYGTFDSEVALVNSEIEFLAFGHHIVDKLIDHVRDDSFGGDIGIKGISNDKPFLGMLFNYIVSFESATKTCEFFPIILDFYNLLDEYEIDDLEKQLADHNMEKKIVVEKYESRIATIVENMESHFANASLKIQKKVKDRVNDKVLDMDLQIDPELDKIHESFDKKLKELHDKLELQESQMKWYGKDMKSVITRSRNLIIKTEREKQNLLNEYKGYIGVKFSIKMLNCAILIAE